MRQAAPLNDDIVRPTMGYDFTLSFEVPEPIVLDRMLRGHQYFSQFSEEFQTYELRTPENSGTMPNAEVSLSEDGLYFCDYDGSCSELRAEFVSWIESSFGQGRIEEL